MSANWRRPAGLHSGSAGLPDEGGLPSFDGATGWLNSPPLTAAALAGKVVLASFWTYTCINWLRQLPYVRAWAETYSGDKLAVIGVHTPEFSFEHDTGNIRRAVQDLQVGYPVAIDNDYAVWRAFSNHYWPALYIADARGRLRHHYFGEGEYQRSEMVIQQLLAEASSAGSGQGLGPAAASAAAAASASGIEAAADWATLASPETYAGYDRTENFASPGGMVPGRPHAYETPGRLALNHWALAGDWTAADEAAVLNRAGGQIAYRFRARDLNLILAPPAPGGTTRFQVRLDGQPPGEAHGGDADGQGQGTVTEPRLYQLIRQAGPVGEHTFEITFPDSGVRAYAFTFG